MTFGLLAVRLVGIGGSGVTYFAMDAQAERVAGADSHSASSTTRESRAQRYR
jgi:hypothetical protein